MGIPSLLRKTSASVLKGNQGRSPTRPPPSSRPASEVRSVGHDQHTHIHLYAIGYAFASHFKGLDQVISPLVGFSSVLLPINKPPFYNFSYCHTTG
ncbi:unnamed protein product [Urochloa humidicola]